MIFNNNFFLCISYVSRAFSVLRAYIIVDLTWEEELFDNVHVGIVLRLFLLRLFASTPFSRLFSVIRLLSPYFWWGMSLLIMLILFTPTFFANAGRKTRTLFYSDGPTAVSVVTGV
jgi:hypothetical protein